MVLPSGRALVSPHQVRVPHRTWVTLGCSAARIVAAARVLLVVLSTWMDAAVARLRR